LKTESSKTLLCAAAILMVIGFVVMSPAAGLLCSALGAVSAIAALFSPSTTHRVLALILTVLTLGLAGTLYPSFNSEQTAYLRAHPR
jgi:ABC-type antimicrobial peptide transport system permease subunit